MHPSRDASSSIRSLSRSPDPFGYPSRSSPRSPHGGRGRLRFFHSVVLERGSSMLALRRSRSLRFDHPLGGRGRVRPFSSHLSVQKVRSACTPASAFILRARALSPCDDRARARGRSPLCVRACFTSVHLAMNDVPAFAPASRCSLAQSRDPLTFRRSSLLYVREQPRSLIGRLPCSLALRRSDTSVVGGRPLRRSRFSRTSDTFRCRRYAHSCSPRGVHTRARMHEPPLGVSDACGARVCASPLLPSLFRAPASVPTPARVFRRSRRVRRWVPTFRLRLSGRRRRARLLGVHGRVRLATFAFTFHVRVPPSSIQALRPLSYRLATT